MCVTQPIGPLTREAHSPAEGTSLLVASPGPFPSLYSWTFGHLHLAGCDAEHDPPQDHLVKCLPCRPCSSYVGPLGWIMNVEVPRPL